MGRMHVADFEARALARQAARPERRHAALVGDFGQRVVLVHELRQLRRTEELLDRSADRLGVDQILRGQVFGFGECQALADRAFDTDQAGAEHVLGHFTDRTDAAVAQVVDVVGDIFAVADRDDLLHHVGNVGAIRAQFGSQRLGGFVLQHLEELAVVQNARAGGLIAAQTTVELHAADGRQIVLLGSEEQAFEQRLGRFLRGRLAGAHHPVDFDQRFELGASRVDVQRRADVRALVEIVDEQRRQFLDPGGAQLGQQHFGDFGVGSSQQLAGVGVDDVARQNAADDVAVRHFKLRDLGFANQLDVTRRDRLAGFDEHLLAVDDIELRLFTLQTLGHQVPQRAVFLQRERVDFMEHRQHLLVVVAQRAHQDRRRQLAATVDADEQVVLRVEFEVQPGAAVRNDAGAIQQLAGAVRLALVVIEEHARRTMQLRNDDTLGAVDDEGAVVGHQRHFAEIDLLLTDVLDALFLRLTVEDHQAHGDFQRAGERQATNAALDFFEHRLIEAVLDVLEHRAAVVAGHREHRLEGRVQTRLLALGGRRVGLQELAIRVDLGGQQERNLQRVGQLAEILADALFGGERVGHLYLVSRPRYRRAVEINASGCSSKSMAMAEAPAAGHCHGFSKRRKAGGASPQPLPIQL